MKRGGTDYSFVIGIDKPQGCTSHDIVNKCRGIFGEKRIGHTGTLDPLASGAMAVCVGPATKLSNYLTFHDKEYLARIVFGCATATDDLEGEVIRQAPVPPEFEDTQVAMKLLAGILGPQSQLPPAYSAVKVGGVKSYDAARRGSVIDLTPRDIVVNRADLIQVGRDERGSIYWDVRFDVSAGTYIRSIARDLGVSNGTCAHLGGLRRLRSGRLSVGQCVSIEALAENPDIGRIDPIWLLGVRFVAVDGTAQQKAASNGGLLSASDLELLERRGGMDDGLAAECCLPSAAQSTRPLAAGELVGVLNENKLIALYEYVGGSGMLKPRCGFAQGVTRGIV